MEMQRQFGGRSLFWPLVLIGVGLVWLLNSLGVLQTAHIVILLNLWPLILIVLGVHLLFGRRSPRLGTMIGVGAVAVVVLLMFVGPSLGWAQGAEVKTATYQEALEDTQTANVSLEISVADTTVKALSDSANLFEADLSYIGELAYAVSGGSDKSISLRQIEDSEFGNSFNFFNLGFFDQHKDLSWDVGLSKDVALNLEINSGVSDSTLDLQDLNLTGLALNGGIGTTTLNLPAAEHPYDVEINGGAGTTNIRVEENASINLNIGGGVGEVTLDVPDGAAVRLEASTGIGSVDVPSNYTQVNGEEEKFLGEDGVWESPNFSESSHQIIVHFEGGVGTFNLK
jgi:hypothetical protein